MSRKKKTYRLLRRASQEFLFLSVISFLVTTIALFVYTKHLLDAEYEEELESRVSFIATSLRKDHQEITIKPILEVSPVNNHTHRVFKDTIIYDSRQNEHELFNELTKSVDVNGKIYKITVRTLVIESEDILEAIVISFLTILAVVFFILFFVNKNRNKRLWEPFFNSLAQLKTFSLESEQPLDFTLSNILEFHELNEQLSEITDKLRADYRNLKQFTTDMAHEIQTPLAIIQAKVDNLISQNEINDIQFEELTAIQKEIKRLAHLSNNLSLLTKIDNHQFPDTTKVDITAQITEKMEHFHGLTNQEFKWSGDNGFEVDVNPHLADILLNNLLTNAMKYGDRHPIYIETASPSLIIRNSGKNPIGHPEKIFDRFYKEGKHPKSTGLGLSIVKKICDYYGFVVCYRFESNQHIFQVKFKSASL